MRMFKIWIPDHAVKHVYMSDAVTEWKLGRVFRLGVSGNSRGHQESREVNLPRGCKHWINIITLILRHFPPQRGEANCWSIKGLSEELKPRGGKRFKNHKRHSGRYCRLWRASWREEKCWQNDKCREFFNPTFVVTLADPDFFVPGNHHFGWYESQELLCNGSFMEQMYCMKG